MIVTQTNDNSIRVTVRTDGPVKVASQTPPAAQVVVQPVTPTKVVEKPRDQYAEVQVLPSGPPGPIGPEGPIGPAGDVVISGSDFSLTGAQDQDVIVYDGQAGKWIASTMPEEKIIEGGHF